MEAFSRTRLLRVTPNQGTSRDRHTYPESSIGKRDRVDQTFAIIIASSHVAFHLLAACSSPIADSNSLVARRSQLAATGQPPRRSRGFPFRADRSKERHARARTDTVSVLIDETANGRFLLLFFSLFSDGITRGESAEDLPALANAT